MYSTISLRACRSTQIGVSLEKYEMAENELFIRNRYYPGKLLHAGDFIKEQEYGSRKLEFVNHKFLGCGIIEGLKIRVEENGGLILGAGSAIDPLGRILLSPRDTQWKIDDIENLDRGRQQAFILGIHYAEKPVETERVLLDKEINSYQVARIAETISLRAYSEEEWRSSWFKGSRGAELLVQEKVLYENEKLRLALRLPKLIPRDSIFRMRVQIQVTGKERTSIRWRGTAKLQGAVFAVSGRSHQILEKEWTGFSGTMQQEWEICTEEDRKLPVALELSELEVAVEDFNLIEPENCQFYIDTASEYYEAVQKKLRGETEREQNSKVDWIPLAYLKLQQNSEEERPSLSVIKDFGLRTYIARPGGEELFRRTEEENGIIDIRWRKLLKGFKKEPRPPFPHLPKPSEKLPDSPERGNIPQWLRELTEEERSRNINRGMTVISIPRRCRRGQILYSDEISHGFPGEEVLICWGVIYENRDYVYWNHSKVQYTIVQGDQKLFPKLWDTGREAGKLIERQALRQNVEKGTFQIALTLSAVPRKNRGREVAITWTAFRTV